MVTYWFATVKLSGRLPLRAPLALQLQAPPVEPAELGKKLAEHEIINYLVYSLLSYIILIIKYTYLYLSLSVAAGANVLNLCPMKAKG